MDSKSFDLIAEIEKLTPRQIDHMQRTLHTNIIEGILHTNHTPQEVAACFWEKYQHHLDTVINESPNAITKGYMLIDNVPFLKRLNNRPNANEMKQKIIVAVFHFQQMFLAERDKVFYEEFREYILSPGLADKRLAELHKQLEAVKIVLDKIPLSASTYNELFKSAILLQNKIDSGKTYISRQHEVELQDFLVQFPEALVCMKEFILCRQEGAPSNVFRDACVVVLLDILKQHPKEKVTQAETRKLVATLMTNCFQCKMSVKGVENIDLSIKNISPNN